ncbi:probable mannitol dehydrogenase [Pistacia vera]|uniref:probable mannitol dehydrogenase n=1 Tax=Pistacia vera TaxID=55513 RepID=UPI001262E4C1|nr:probable mannitol dehydrogenase [Pistacia vera]
MAFGWAARDTSGLLSPFSFSRRVTGEKDVTFKVLYCGICHCDLHMIKNDWGYSIYTIVPGHEIVRAVIEVGSKVEKFKVRVRVHVGSIVESCHSCDNCASEIHIYCPKFIPTQGTQDYDGATTHGSYSAIMVANEHFVIPIPDDLLVDASAPLLYAGIIVYSPLRYYGLDKLGMHVGVVGPSGLGHVAVKFANAMGVKVTVISNSLNKKKEAIDHLGVDSFFVSSNQDEIKAAMSKMDGIIDIVSIPYPILPLIGLSRTNEKLLLVGCLEKPLELPVFTLLLGRDIIVVNCIYIMGGGTNRTQDMFHIKGQHNSNTLMNLLSKAHVRYCFVIDIGNHINLHHLINLLLIIRI